MPNLSRSKGSHAEAIVKDINTILVRNGISETIFPEDITVTDKAVSDHVKPVSKLSDCITEYLWPSIRSEVLSHYTSWEAAESIGRSKTFRFGNIEKRYGEGEITTFCQVHQLHGYLAPDAHGEPRYKNLLMPNMFYASFTDSAVGRDEEEYF